MCRLRTLPGLVVRRNQNVNLCCLAGLNFDSLTPSQLSGRVGHLQRVLSFGNFFQVKATLCFRHLIVGMIEDVDPGAHGTVVDAAHSVGLVYATGLVKRLDVRPVRGHVDVKRVFLMKGLHIVRRAVAVEKLDTIAGPYGRRFRCELKILLVDDNRGCLIGRPALNGRNL